MLAPGSILRTTILAAVVLAACGGPVTMDGVTILRYGPQSGSPAATASGTLRFLGGCAVLENGDPSVEPAGWLILWPPGTELRHVNDRLGVAAGGSIAFEGDLVELGGGEQKDEVFVESLVGPVGECKSDVYWMASSLKVLGR